MPLQGKVGWRTGALLPNLTTSGLILHLDSGNSSSYSGSGTAWIDLSGNNRNATLYNAPTYSSLDGGKLIFDGINDYAEVANPPALGSNDFTIEVWFKRKESTLSWDNGYLFSTWNTGAIGGSNEWGIGFGDESTSNGNNINFGLEAQGGGFYGIYSNEILINTWYQAVVTREAGTLKMYINGSLRTTATPSVTYYGALGTKAVNSVGRKLRIAYHDTVGSTLYTNVEVPIIRMYNRTLNSTEIAQNYLANKSRFGMEDNPQIINNLILDINPALYTPGSSTLINPANVGNNIKVWGNGTDSTSSPIWNRKWFTFDGINDYLEITDSKSLMFGTQSFTVSGWLKQKNPSPGWAGATINKWYTGAQPGNNNWSLGLLSDYSVLKPNFTIDSSGTFYSVSSSETISAHNWYHVVAVRDGGTLKIYVNGVLKGSNSPSGFATRSITALPRPTYIGRTGIGINALQDSGRMQIYNRALTDSEILSLYNTQKTDFIITNGLQFYIDASLPSSYTSGTSVTDISGNGLIGTLANGVGYTATNEGAFTFDGINDYVTIPDSTTNRFSNQFSTSLSFYWDGISRTNNTLFAKRNTDPYNSFSFGINNGDPYNGGTGRTLMFFARPDQGGGNILFPNAGTLDSLLLYDLGTTPKNVHATVTIDSNSQKLYINGTLVSSISINLTSKTFNITGRPVVLGATRDNANGYFNYANTRIYSAQLYNRTLTDTEVQHNFEVLRTRLGL
jgi:hypothetical protein